VLVRNGIQNIRVINTSRRLGDIKRNFSDIRKAKELLNWQAEMSLEKGIEETLNWFIRAELNSC